MARAGVPRLPELVCSAARMLRYAPEGFVDQVGAPRIEISAQADSITRGLLLNIWGWACV